VPGTNVRVMSDQHPVAMSRGKQSMITLWSGWIGPIPRPWISVHASPDWIRMSFDSAP
jgi:hypothetical protein